MVGFSTYGERGYMKKERKRDGKRNKEFKVISGIKPSYVKKPYPEENKARETFKSIRNSGLLCSTLTIWHLLYILASKLPVLPIWKKSEIISVIL